MIHVGMDLHRNNCLVVAICDQTGERFPARRIDHDRIETLWQYLDQFQGDPPIPSREAAAAALLSPRWGLVMFARDLVPRAHRPWLHAVAASRLERIDPPDEEPGLHSEAGEGP